MLTHLHIRNFKAWQDTGPVRLAPLTVIFGANSAGKSSLGHLLLALQQTARSSDRKRALHLGDPSSLIDLGTFVDCLHGRDPDRALSFELGWTLPAPLDLRDPLQAATRYAGDRMRLDVTLAANKAQQAQVQALRYALASAGGEVLDVALRRDEKQQPELLSDRYRFRLAEDRQLPLEEPEKFYRFSDASMARYQNAGFLADFALATETMLEHLAYLGPLRSPPRRIYPWSGETPASVGQMGEYTVAAILAAQDAGRRLGRHDGQQEQGFAEFIAAWLKELDVIHDFSVRALAPGRKEYEVLLKTRARAPEVALTDVGFGISQMLPALVQAFYCPPHSTVWMEQPEIHLHPQVQAGLADLFIAATQACENGKPRHAQLIVESHSEHFLNRLQRRVAEGVVSHEDVAVYFCRRSEAGAELEPLRLNRLGEIENWPEHFFGDEMADIAGRALAALRHRQKTGQSGDKS